MAVRPGRALGAGVLLLVSLTAQGAVPRTGPRIPADTLTAMPGAQLTKPLRTAPRVLWNTATPPAPWQSFTAAAGGTWNAAWDAATGVPSRIWGSGIAAPGSVADPAIAESIARTMLAQNLALLAPGAALEDFTLVSNRLDGDMRVVGFRQDTGGHNVLGGQVSFRFKHDRLFVIGSEAYPYVHVPFVKARLLGSELLARATTTVRAATVLPAAPVRVTGPDVIVPLVADDAVLGYRLATPLEIDGGIDGRYAAYVDPGSADVIAIRQLNEYANGTVIYHGVDRNPTRGRKDFPAPLAHVDVNGTPATTSMTGAVSWSPDADATLTTSITGDLVTVVNKSASGAIAMAALPIAPGGAALWDTSAKEEDDAQLITYLSVNIAKNYVRTMLDAQMPTLDEQMVANVNIAQDCNAYFDGKAVNFFHATSTCQNTGMIQDVVFHEYGHRVHTAEIIDGVGAFDGAMSEGAADFLSAIITNDSGMGRGFYFSDDPLRELDPPNSEWSWPVDIGEVHHQGMIFGGTFWDLRKALIVALGETDGIALTNKLYLGALRRSVNIPTSLIEALATDDDDGNLANGTPHECLIRDAFGRHGLRTATGAVEAPGTLDVDAKAIGIVVDVTGLSTRCQGDAIDSAVLDWKPGFTGGPASGSMPATLAGDGRFFAELPLAPQDSIFYKVRIKFADGSQMTLADNLADPFYQLYQGHTVKLYCSDFEAEDPFAHGWTTGTDDGAPSQWQWGVPSAGATDPHTAFSGTHVIAQSLNGDYRPKEYSWIKTPVIDVGQYSDVRLQYRRWLAVEDSHFDQARVTANDKQAWMNFTQNKGESSATHHIDREWRFQDVPLSGYFSGHKLQVGWDLKSDEGLNLGGWALDDVCIVANPNSVCGDGVKQITEQCDTGAMNADVPNTCRTDCRLPSCGDGILDMNEECDEGSGSSTTCSPMCKLLPGDGGGCCSASGGGAAGSAALALLVLGGARRRRRRV